jgi:hypothetical protein
VPREALSCVIIAWTSSSPTLTNWSIQRPRSRCQAMLPRIWRFRDRSDEPIPRR